MSKISRTVSNIIWLGIILASMPSHSADILDTSYISCISDETASKARVQEYKGDEKANRIRSWFTNWMFGGNNDAKSKVDLVWHPVTDKGPSAKIITSEKPHNLIRVRSKTRDSAIIVSSASSPMTTESWTFSLNFNLETMVATRVQSNLSGVRGEVLTYDCKFEDLTPTIELPASAPIG